MALSRTNRGAHTADATSVTSSSFTPAADSLLVAYGCAEDTTGNTLVEGDLAISGGSLSWQPINSHAPEGASAASMWYAIVGSSPSSMTVQLTTNGEAEHCALHIVEYSGYDTADPIGAVGESFEVANGAITLDAAPATDSEVFAGVMNESVNPGNAEPGSGFTELNDPADSLGSHTQVRTGSTSTSVAWTGLGDVEVALAVEIKASQNAVFQQSRFRFFTPGDELPHFDLTTPVIEAADGTGTAITTAADPWAINHPAASTGDLLIWLLTWDDSTNVTSVAAPSGPNGETINSIAGPIASNGTEIRQQAFYTIATGSWSSGTLSFNPSNTETVTATCIKVPAGEFNASDPIGAAATRASAGTAESSVLSPAFSAESGDANGRLVLLFGSDADAITAPGSDFTTVRNQTAGGVGHLVGVRDSAVSASESIAALTATITSDSWCSIGFVVKPPEVADGRTPAAANDTGITLDVADQIGLSIRIQNTAGGTSSEDDFKLQYRLNAGTWTDVSTSSSVIKIVATADYADGDDVPEYLRGSGSYISNNNAALESDGALTLAATMGGATAFELHTTLELVGADVADEDEVELRVIKGTGSALDTYSVTPLITVEDDGGTQTLTPSRFDDGDTFFSATVTRGAVTLTQSARFDDGDTFFAPKVSHRLPQSARFDDADTFFSATVTRGAVALVQSARFDDADSFFSPTVTRGAVTLTQSARFDNAQTFNAHTISNITLLTQSARFDDADTFFSPTVLRGAVSLTQSARFDDADAFFSATVTRGAVSLVQSARFDDGDTFFAPTVTRGGVSLTQAARFDDGDTFFSATVLRGVRTLVQSARFDDADSFFAATVTRGAVTLTQSARFDDADTFFAHQIVTGEGTLFPNFYTDPDTFFAPTVTRGAVTLSAQRFDNANAFFSAQINQRLAQAARFDDADTFFAHSIGNISGLQPQRFDDGDTFFSPTIVHRVQPGLFSNAQTFFAPTVLRGSLTLQPARFDDGDTFFAATITQTADGELLAQRFDNVSVFYAAAVLHVPPSAARPWIHSGRRTLNDNPTPSWLRRRLAPWLRN
jgi:hypothetical protein